tara:strand:- start:106 stop:861 length:756 start_codon:yes stop_codon:yes gene_type:complete
MLKYGDEIEVGDTPLCCAPILRVFNKNKSEQQKSNINEAGYILYKGFEQFRNSELNLSGIKAKKLKNKNKNRNTFGKYNDEIYYGTINNTNYLFFAGSDFQYNIETLQEWASNTFIITDTSPQGDTSFVKEVENSLPDIFKNESIIAMGFSRGGYTMSNFCNNSSLTFKYIIYLAVPGTQYNMKKICDNVYEFYHELDKVVALQKFNPKLKVKSHELFIWKSLKDMNTQQVLSKVHGRGSEGYIKWLKDFS